MVIDVCIKLAYLGGGGGGDFGGGGEVGGGGGGREVGRRRVFTVELTGRMPKLFFRRQLVFICCKFRGREKERAQELLLVLLMTGRASNVARSSHPVGFPPPLVEHDSNEEICVAIVAEDPEAESAPILCSNICIRGGRAPSNGRWNSNVIVGAFNFVKQVPA